MYGSREIGYIGIFSIFFPRNHVRGGQLGKVVHDERGKDFLENGLRLFCMKMKKSECMFEITEGSFNTPTHMVEFFEFRRRKRISIQIGDNGFVRILRDFETYKPERENIRWCGNIFMRFFAGR